jgi:hypothetical protein
LRTLLSERCVTIKLKKAVKEETIKEEAGLKRCLINYEKQGNIEVHELKVGVE